MMKGIWLSLLVAAILVSAGFAQETDRVTSLLREVDSWVTSDTARILQFIDSNNTRTMDALRQSKYWGPVTEDLGFLLGIDLVVSPQIDNTGRIYFQMRLTGESTALFYVDKPMGWPTQMTPNNWPDEGLTISSFAVHPSGDYTLVSTNKHGDEMHDIWYFDRSGAFRPLLVDREVRYSGVIFDRDNPGVFYLSINPKRQGVYVGRYNLSTSQLDTLYTEPGFYAPIDYQEGKVLFVRWFSFSDAQIAVLDVASKNVTNLSDTALFWTGQFMDDGTIVTLTSAMSTAEEFMKLCRLDPSKPKEFTVLYDPKGNEIDNATFIKDRGVFVLGLNKDGYSELAGIDLKGQPVGVPQPEIGVITDMSANDIGDVVYGYSSPTTPPTGYVFAVGGRGITPIAEVSTFGFDFSKVDVKVIQYPGAEGMMIPALLYVPASAKKDGSNPAIVNYHGGPPSQSRPNFARNIAFALSQGFVVMFPNVRGSSGYGPAYERADNLEGRFKALDDAELALDYLINEGWSKPEKIAIWGASYGGYTVNWLAAHASDKIACVVSEVGVADPDWSNRHSVNQNFAAGWEQEYGPVGSELTHKLAPVYYAEQVKTPMLITAGFNDPRVPPSDPRRFFYVLRDLGKPVWYFEEVEAGHGASMKEQLVRDFARNYVFTMMHVLD